MAELAQAAQATPGHFDELRGKTAGMTDVWRQFFSTLENDTVTDMDQRAANLARQVRDNGITYNVYADENGPQRPWSLDLFPLIVDPIAGSASRLVCCSACACWSA